MSDDDHVLCLADGRRLGYAEYGDPGGRPVVALHGCPDSRLIWRLADRPAQDVGVRLIAPDRPGFGLSDPKPGRAVLDRPDDLAELADALDLHEFAILAISAGGVYGIASAVALTARVRALGLLSVIGPLNLPGMTEGMGTVPRVAYTLARRAPWALGLLVRALAATARRDPERAGRQITKTRPPEDRAIIERPDVYAVLLEALPQNFAHPPTVTHEFSLQVRPWGFSAS